MSSFTVYNQGICKLNALEHLKSAFKILKDLFIITQTKYKQKIMHIRESKVGAIYSITPVLKGLN